MYGMLTQTEWKWKNQSRQQFSGNKGGNGGSNEQLTGQPVHKQERHLVLRREEVDQDRTNERGNRRQNRRIATSNRWEARQVDPNRDSNN